MKVETPWRALISVRLARSGAHKTQLRRSWICTVNSTEYTGHSLFERISISEFRLKEINPTVANVPRIAASPFQDPVDAFRHPCECVWVIGERGLRIVNCGDFCGDLSNI